MKIFWYVLWFCSMINFYTAFAFYDDVKFSKEYVEAYAKHMVYLWGMKKTFWHFTAGVIIKDDVILTSFADYDFKNYGNVIAGATKVDKQNDKWDISRIENLGFRSTQFPQISLIQLKRKLPLNKNISVIPLATNPNNDGFCVTLSYKKARYFGALHVRQVIIHSEGCQKGLICFKYRTNANHCEEYASGEPIICSGILIGIVGRSLNCEEYGYHKATSIYANLKWIQSYMNRTYKEFSIVKSGCRTYVHKYFYTFYIIIYIFIQIIYKMFGNFH